MTRTIDIGDVVSKVFRTYRDYARVLLPVAAVLFLIEAVFDYLAIDDTVLGLLAGLIGLILTTLYTGVVVELVSDVRDGRLDQSVGALIGRASPVVVPLIVVSFLAGVGIFVGLILIVVPGLFLLTMWAVVSPVVVLERPGIIAAFRRSWHLVKGNGRQVFGVLVLFFLIVIVVGIVLASIGAALGDGGQVALGWIARLLTAPLVALAAAVLYFELRAAKQEDAAAGAA